MNSSVFKCSKEDSIGKPSYSRFTKTNDFKGVPPPLSGDYTPKPQEEIDDALYVYGKKGPQKPEISVSDENSSEHSTCQSNDSEGSCENTSEHSFETESESLDEPNEMSKSRLEVTNEKDVSAPISKEVAPRTSTEGKLVDRGRYDSGYSGHMTANIAAVKIPEEKRIKDNFNIFKTEEDIDRHKQEMKDSSIDSLEDNPKIQAFRRELEEIALKHLGKGIDNDDSLMPELEIFHKPETGIFDEASYDEEGVITDFNSLPTEIEVSPTPYNLGFIVLPKSQILVILKEPKKIAEALQDDSWVQAMQEELLQFKLQQVWVLVDLPHRMKCFSVGTIDEGSLCRNLLVLLITDQSKKVYKVVKALYGLHQAPRAWYATLSTFLRSNGYKRGTIDKTFIDEKQFQMSSMGELTFFLGLQVKQNKGGIFISQDKYVAEILKKFDLVSVKAAITPMETKLPLTKDEEAFDVDVHLYRSMIGSLMYLTASRPDIMYAVCVCSRFQVTPKTSHLNAVKRIFKYLKGKPHLGLWYPRESPFDLEAFSDSDYGGSNLDRKSTTGGCQFLRQRLISWQCKKQTIMATSTTEAKYVAAANGVEPNPVYHSKTKHIEIRHHFIRDCYEKKLISVEKIHTDLNVADLLTKPFDGPRFNYLVVSIGGGTTISEASIRDSLQLEDATGITMLPNDDLFEGMGQIGYPTDGTFTFWKSFFTPQWRYVGPPSFTLYKLYSGGWDQFGQEHAAVAQSQPSSSSPQVPSSQPTPTPPPITTPTPPPIPTPTPPPIPTPTPPPIPSPTPPPDTEPTPLEHIYEEQSPVHHHFSPPQEQAPSQMPRDDLLHEVPKLISRIDSLEMDLKQTKLTMGNAIVKLVKKVKKLEGFMKRRNLVLTDSEVERI
ncbi:putative ribonuclease H-like domain-containing protein [Tanacetum coccineum]